HVDHVAPGDGHLHRQPCALGLQGILDDLDDDLLPRREQVGDLAPAAAAAPALRRLHAGEDYLIDVKDAVLLQADADERRLQAERRSQAGQHVVDLALVDVADDRALATALYVQLGDAIATLATGTAGLATARRLRRRPRSLRG